MVSHEIPERDHYLDGWREGIKQMAERITCPICGYGKAVHYDYDQGGPGKAQRTGIYLGYCAQWPT